MGELTFTKEGNVWVSEFEATSDFNIHLERIESGDFIVSQRGSSQGSYARAFVVGNGYKVIDYDFGALVYPKYIKVVSGSEVVNGVVTFGA